MQLGLWAAVAVSVPISGISTCSAPDETAETAEATAPVTFGNHHWVSRYPKDARDAVQWLSAVRPKEGRAFGVAQRRSVFRFVGETFWWKASGRTLMLQFPQDRREVTVDAKAYRCDKGRFDRCLDLTWKGRTATMYSMDDLRIPPQDGTVLVDHDLGSFLVPEPDAPHPVSAPRVDIEDLDELPEPVRELFVD